MKEEMTKDLRFVLKHYKTETLDTKKALKEVKRRAGIRTQRLSWKWTSIAAMLLAFIATGTYYAMRPSATVIASGDVLLNYTLPDSTHLTLSPHSTLSYQGNNCRKVNMTGKIYFQVRHDELHPFDIQGKICHVRVLGTQFEVAENNSFSEVFVTSGRVLFSSRFQNEGLILTKGMKARLTKGEKKPVKTGTGDVNCVAWATHQFHFENTPLKEVLACLSDYYHVQLTSDDPDKRLSGDFDADSIQQITALIEHALNVRIERK